MTRDYFTIGEVVQKLSSSFPDLTPSKLRFLEDEGLLTPNRTASGYRKFSKDDVTRLKIILTLQKEHFFPLTVIKEKLVEFDAGILSQDLIAELKAKVDPDDTILQKPEGAILVKEITSTIGIPENFLTQLEEFGLISIDRTPQAHAVSRNEIPIIQAAWKLTRYGVEPRHLRMYVTFAQRESTFFAQILHPTYRHKTPESKAKLNQSLLDIYAQTEKIKSELFKNALSNELSELL